jgi:hypothetical protein
VEANQEGRGTLKLTIVEKVGSLGVLGTAAACPVCWPLFAAAGSALGLGALAPFEPTLMNIVFPAFVIVTLIGGLLGYVNHRRISPLAVNVVSVGLILYGFYGGWHVKLMYAGIFGVLIATGLGYFANRQCRLAKT